MGEGQTGGRGGGGSQRGQLRGFNINWDADWTVRTRSTERGWEAEFEIPLKTLRYTPGEDRVWGINVMRNIRRKNEQVFLSPVPRGYTLHRVSVAGKLNGLSLPTRRLATGAFSPGRKVLLISHVQAEYPDRGQVCQATTACCARSGYRGSTHLSHVKQGRETRNKTARQARHHS